MTANAMKLTHRNIVILFSVAGGVTCLTAAGIVVAVISWLSLRASETPAGRAEAFFAALEACNEDAVYDLIAPSSRRKFAEGNGSFGQNMGKTRSPRQACAELTQFLHLGMKLSAKGEAKRIKIVGCDTEGDRSWVRIAGLGADEETVPLVREEKRWYVKF